MDARDFLTDGDVLLLPPNSMAERTGLERTAAHHDR
jgi:hypothetical protein